MTERVSERVRLAIPNCTHPGLLLDKYLEPGDGKAIKPRLDKLVKRGIGDESLLAARLGLRQEMFSAQSCMQFRAELVSPLALHLSRAGALDNGSTCLHPLYGFAYLPSSGLKGLASAWAEVQWLEGRPKDEREKDRADILAVFGCAPGDARANRWSLAKTEGRQGAVVFHDAWPLNWPALQVDVVTNHHQEYYNEASSPGDWESPNPVYFLTINESATFSFALGLAQEEKGEEGQRLMALAAEWLKAGLTHMGAGAKTNAGYGYFKVLDSEVTPRPLHAAAFTTELTLETPAFFAGADQKKADCDLRSATLRGQLRWWWRTMHAGHLCPADLLALEAQLFGIASNGAAIGLKLTSLKRPDVGPVPFKKTQDGSVDANYFTKRGIPKPLRVQALQYGSYGMAEGKDSAAWRQLAYPGAKWQLEVFARSTTVLPAQQILAEAKAALSLLVKYGGVGAKTRSGYGSLGAASTASFAQMDIESCKAVAAESRKKLGLEKGMCVGASTLENMLQPCVATVATQDPWQALSACIHGYQKFATDMKHHPEKAWLGLPRKIDGPQVDKKDAQGRPSPPIHLWDANHRPPNTTPKNIRWARPIHLSVHSSAVGFCATAVVFDTGVMDQVKGTDELQKQERTIPLATTRSEFYKNFVGGFVKEVTSYPLGATVPTSSPPLPSATGRKFGTAVTLTITETEPKVIGKESDGKTGIVVNIGVPLKLPTVGDSVTVYIKDDKSNNRQYQWIAPPPPKPDPGRGGRGGGGFGGRR